MWFYHRRVLLTLWLAAVPGCSEGPGPGTETELVPVADGRGLITYRPKGATPPDPVSTPTPEPGWEPGEPDPAELRRRQQEQIRAEYQSRQDRQAQFRREQQDFQAYAESRRQNEMEQVRASRELQRQYETERRQALEEARDVARVDQARRQQSAQQLDFTLRRMRQQQQNLSLQEELRQRQRQPLPYP